MRFPAFHQRRGRPRRLGNSLGQYPPARPAQAEAANLVPIGGTMDQRSRGIARPTNRLDWVSELAPKGRPRLNKRRGRLAQLVRASRLHREGRRFESVTAYQTNRQLGFSGLPLRQGYAALMPRNPMAWGRVCFAP